MAQAKVTGTRVRCPACGEHLAKLAVAQHVAFGDNGVQLVDGPDVPLLRLRAGWAERGGVWQAPDPGRPRRPAQPLRGEASKQDVGRVVRAPAYLACPREGCGTVSFVGPAVAPSLNDQLREQVAAVSAARRAAKGVA